LFSWVCKTPFPAPGITRVAANGISHTLRSPL
jgi:hypothetical protein